ncbi:uncharacterized protein N7506_001195 [Penicillium brevicompactum]|uniref:uncharacterized protein n=1 Tax=Penicillium brevicompactum TaxID=5074 RepID=UPI0025410462|nr:uncharacterized protein N7506_001195 [Penicillium brevicompactum]KAJ5347942.1 hypothetical protein N7506_001195 [Penicillium brevicompactum]
MNQDRSREESKPTPLAQLGQFSKLPPELRFQIWNYLFDDFKSTSSSSGPISILFCNRGLYEETSRILYEHRVFSLTINIDSWIEDSLEFTAIVEVIKGARTPVAVKCIQLRCLDDVLRLLQQSPSWRLHRCGPCIRVRYFYLLSPSKELWLWECVHSIVKTLKLLPNGKHIRFTTFHPRPQRPRYTMELTKSGVLKDWFDERFPGEPLPFPDCPFTGTHNHNDPPGPCLNIPVYHYAILKAIDSFELGQHEQNRLHTESRSSRVEFQPMKNEYMDLSRLHPESLPPTTQFFHTSLTPRLLANTALA